MTFDLYFAGGYAPEVDETIQQLAGCRLHTQISRKICNTWVEDVRSGKYKGKLFIDSGAFTAHRKDINIDIDEYIEYINSIDDGIEICANLDIIPGKWGHERTHEQVLYAAEKSWENYIYIRERVKHPDKVLPVFHQDEPFEYLERMLNTTFDGKHIPYICISGSKDRHPKKRRVWYHRVFSVIEQSMNPKVKTHCLGNFTTSELEYFPFTSSDATSWIMTSATGSIITPWGNVYVSDWAHTKDNVSIDTHINYVKLKEYVESLGFNLEELASSYVARGTFNVKYMKNWADNYVYKGPKTFIQRGLF